MVRWNRGLAGLGFDSERREDSMKGMTDIQPSIRLRANQSSNGRSVPENTGKRVTVLLDVETFRMLEKWRGNVNRSLAVRDLLRKAMQND